jgi:sarcosine oxidase gamma subunit
LGFDAPSVVYDAQPIVGGGLIVRLGGDEFMIESGSSELPSLLAKFDEYVAEDDRRVYRVEHQEATILLVGERAIDVMSQTCGINFLEARKRRLIFTRVAGVSCGVLPESFDDKVTYRIWVDYTYATYLWETLVEICGELGGEVIGAQRVLRESP